MNYLLKSFFLITLLIAASSAPANGVSDIDNQGLNEHMQQGVPVIDVRTTSEWKKTGIVEGSHLMMFFDEKGKYDLNAWLAELSNVVKKNEPLILICHSGGRSKQLANYLVNVAGYSEVYNVKKGIVDWMKQENPTTPVQ